MTDCLRRFTWPAALGCLSFLLLTGCAGGVDPINPSNPWMPPIVRGTPQPLEPSSTPAPVGAPDMQDIPVRIMQPVEKLAEPSEQDPYNFDPGTGVGTIIRVGQLLRVIFNDVIPQPPPYDVHVRDDGTIGLPLNVRLTAAGKSARQLEETIHDAYVPKYYRILTVNVATADLFYFVGGEVRIPSRQQFAGPISVTRAIDTAGGFTDFARKSRIELRRANGEIIRVDYNKARRNPEKDPLVYPGDQVLVPKRGPLW